MEARKGRGYVYALEYHIVWCTKYRRKVLSGPVEIRLKELLSTLAKENETAILEMEVMEDHVHLLIQASPQVFLPTLLKIFKGVSARLLFKEFGSVFLVMGGSINQKGNIQKMEKEQVRKQREEPMTDPLYRYYFDEEGHFVREQIEDYKRLDGGAYAYSRQNARGQKKHYFVYPERLNTYWKGYLYTFDPSVPHAAAIIEPYYQERLRAAMAEAANAQKKLNTLTNGA